MISQLERWSACRRKNNRRIVLMDPIIFSDCPFTNGILFFWVSPIRLLDRIILPLKEVVSPFAMIFVIETPYNFLENRLVVSVRTSFIFCVTLVVC
jgi:hypothetical protein